MYKHVNTSNEDLYFVTIICIWQFWKTWRRFFSN